MDVWIEEDPYRSPAAGLRVAELRGEVERSTAVLTPIDGAITFGGRGACACALLLQRRAAKRR